MNIYAVIKTGGKQYRVSPGDIVRVERFPARPGERVEIGDVFLLVNGGNVAVGNPTVAGVRVVGEVVEEGRGEKIRIVKKRRRKHYQKTIGHRQYYSAIRIAEIIQGDTKHGGGVELRRVGASAASSATPVAPPPARKPARQPSGSEGSGESSRGATPMPADGPPAARRPPLSDAGVGTAAPRVHTPASTVAKEAASPAPSGNDGGAASGGTPEAKPERRRQVAMHDMPERAAKPPSPANPPPIPRAGPATAAAHRADRADAQRAVSATIETPTREASRRVRLWWPLAALLALLLGILGWLFKGNEEPASEPALVDAQPTPQPVPRPPVPDATVRKPASEPALVDAQPTPQPVPRPPVPDATVRKPARVPAPSAPEQPPD